MLTLGRTVVAASAALALLTNHALANHGPGTSGGGSATISGETLKTGNWDLDFRLDFTRFQPISDSEAINHAQKGGEFDSLEWSQVTTVSLAYGVTDDFQVGASWGWYAGRDFQSAEFDSGTGTTELSDADPHGIIDLWIDGKYRLLRGEAGNLAVIGGVKLPTGRDDVKLSNGEELEPSSQPGTGSIDWHGGAAWSRFLTPQLTADASALYTIRTSHDKFEVGDRFDLGVALAWRLTESIQQFPQWSVFGECNVVWLGKDDDAGTKNDNSGGTTLYVTPGGRIRFNKLVALTLAPSFPLFQDLNGEQVETRYKVAATLSFSF